MFLYRTPLCPFRNPVNAPYSDRILTSRGRCEDGRWRCLDLRLLCRWRRRTKNSRSSESGATVLLSLSPSNTKCRRNRSVHQYAEAAPSYSYCSFRLGTDAVPVTDTAFLYGRFAFDGLLTITGFVDKNEMKIIRYELPFTIVVLFLRKNYSKNKYSNIRRIYLFRSKSRENGVIDE